MANYRNRMRAILLPLLLAAAIVGGILFGNYLGRTNSTSQLQGLLQQMVGTQNKLSYTLTLIQREYVDSISVDTLAERVLPHLMKELDPHSVYIPAAEMAELDKKVGVTADETQGILIFTV